MPEAPNCVAPKDEGIGVDGKKGDALCPPIIPDMFGGKAAGNAAPNLAKVKGSVVLGFGAAAGDVRSGWGAYAGGGGVAPMKGLPNCDQPFVGYRLCMLACCF